MGDTLIKTQGISKEFSGVRVLDNIDIEINKGEIFGIIGENGAGKSTLVKILSGIYTPTEGKVFFEGNEVDIKDPLHAKVIGISMIPQEFNLINELNVYENIFLGSEITRKGFLKKREMKKRTVSLLEELKKSIHPEEKIERLSVAQKQMVEIAKAIAFDSKLLIMDEPTTVLTLNEIETLFDLMRNLKESGVTIIYISHKLKEVREICDRVMVLRDGKTISISQTDEADEEEMARRMVGRELSQVFPEKVSPSEEIVFQVENVTSHGLLEDISFGLRKGEILGFAGLVGAGRTELAETIIGIRKKDSGKISINGKSVEIKSPIDAVKNKIAYLSEDRQGSGVLTSFDMIKNTTLISLPAYSKILINNKLEKEKTKKYVDKFNIRAASLKTRLEFFSGGNQQKVSLAKSLDPEPEIFIFDEPTRGIDVNAKREIYRFMNELVMEGVSCILISSELEEIIGMCNRVIVMKEGRITGILEGEHINEEEIMLHATGLKGVA
ncbi:MAG: sugar ABC transporter ATP-binding protein [Mesotoga sp.]|jgi:ribose transport system ATP-binding protein|uniref:sugar ABC transporter ATP-binding protein n=1 Tax=unclassified Mesotoga TaxID=1184398 RepID=UPI0003A3658F|nr:MULTISPECIES: sugar ABC transporter ATP-binding protein [unclassified Mesotoga]MDI9369098.1 sugar ABC transporter ATP-binding protein [Thermotogota bacterium]NLT46040.1 sugar ABC transporter ATP-binding protein [Thermotogaceae bacterium]MDD2333193.1 sugar ABC transporter ATP-binding protein [Mesotoga sp.]MDD3680040.1 sugar ABC transporter ATP-binding protein [Mesotoga sp.]MDD4206982.1 sugar ABC transporter ATP-binding protein [Mesotoga sp.]